MASHFCCGFSGDLPSAGRDLLGSICDCQNRFSVNLKDSRACFA
jgi:hypothetical protein